MVNFCCKTFPFLEVVEEFFEFVVIFGEDFCFTFCAKAASREDVDEVDFDGGTFLDVCEGLG